MLRLLEWHRLCLLQRKALWGAARLLRHRALRFLRMLPFARLRYDTRDNAIGYAIHSSRSHRAMIRVYDDAGNLIETHEHEGNFREP